MNIYYIPTAGGGNAPKLFSEQQINGAEEAKHGSLRSFLAMIYVLRRRLEAFMKTTFVGKVTKPVGK